MNILFLYDHTLRPEAGGTSRASSLVMQALSQRGHRAFGHLHFMQGNTGVVFYNEHPIASLNDFLKRHEINVVVNQIAYHHWLLEAFLACGGEKWVENGGKIVSFMHFDPRPHPFLLRPLFEQMSRMTLSAKFRRLVYICLLPYYLPKYEKRTQQSLRYVYEKSDLYIVMSQAYIQSFSLRTGIGALDKMRVIPNMLTFSESLKEEELSTKERVVIVVARLSEEQKRLSFVLRVWKRIKNHQGYKLQIIGEGPDREHYIRYVKKNTLDDVEFLGHQSPLSFYRKARIFLMSSPREGWGLTITESMQCGVVPLVLNTSDVFQDIITNEIDGYLASDEKDFQEKLEVLLQDDKRRNSMARAALKNVSRFSQLAVGNRWETVLKEIIA